MMNGLQQVGAQAAKITDIRTKKISIQFVKFPSRDFKVLLVRARKIVSCVFRRNKSRQLR
jgi:hypothetical protein